LGKGHDGSKRKKKKVTPRRRVVSGGQRGFRAEKKKPKKKRLVRKKGRGGGTLAPQYGWGKGKSAGGSDVGGKFGHVWKDSSGEGLMGWLPTATV